LGGKRRRGLYKGIFVKGEKKDEEGYNGGLYNKGGGGK
jgi:hypothetical protein